MHSCCFHFEPNQTVKPNGDGLSCVLLTYCLLRCDRRGIKRAKVEQFSSSSVWKSMKTNDYVWPRPSPFGLLQYIYLFFCDLFIPTAKTIRWQICSGLVETTSMIYTSTWLLWKELLQQEMWMCETRYLKYTINREACQDNTTLHIV